jgi:hypothetical protein
MEIKGVLNVSRRANQGLKASSLSDAYDVSALSHAWLSLDPNGANRDVVLPDATTLTNGWSVIIENTADASESLVVKDNSTGNVIKTIVSPTPVNQTLAYQFVLKDNSTADGVWYAIELGDPTIDITKYYDAFEVADWSVPSGELTTLNIAGTTHGKGNNPMWSVHNDTGSKVYCHDEVVNVANGNITLTITEDDEFDGFIIVF